MKSFKQFITESEKEWKIADCFYYDTKYELTDKGYIVHGNVSLIHGQLTKIPFKFYKVEGYFNCSNNKLTSLKGSPEIVRGSFNCSNNRLTSLQGSPKIVGGYFDCMRNRLKEIKELPQVKGKIFIDNPKLLEDYYNQLRAKGLNDLGYNDTENTDIL